MVANIPEPREGASFGSIKDPSTSQETYILFGGRNSNNYFTDTWELSLSPFAWTKLSDDQTEVTNVVGGFIQQAKDSNQILLVGGSDINGDSDNPTWQRNEGQETWIRRSAEDKIEAFDSTPDVVDWLGLVSIKDNDPTVTYNTSLPLALSWESGTFCPLRYYHANTNKWRFASGLDSSKITSAFGSYVWLEWPTTDTPCKMYILGGYDKNGLPLKLFQTVELTFVSGQPPPFPPNAEIVSFQNQTVIADSTDALFTVDSSTPIFQGNPLVADGIANIRVGNNANSRLNTPNNVATSSTSNTAFSLSCGVFDDELGYLTRDELDTHTIFLFSSFAQIRLIELYVIKSSGTVKVKVPLEDFGPHPELPSNRMDFSITPIGIDSNNRCQGLLLFGGSMDGIQQNDLWTITVDNIGTSAQRFIWTRKN
jgi:hypothetical protein